MKLNRRAADELVEHVLNGWEVTTVNRPSTLESHNSEKHKHLESLYLPYTVITKDSFVATSIYGYVNISDEEFAIKEQRLKDFAWWYGWLDNEPTFGWVQAIGNSKIEAVRMMMEQYKSQRWILHSPYELVGGWPESNGFYDKISMAIQQGRRLKVVVQFRDNGTVCVPITIPYLLDDKTTMYCQTATFVSPLVGHCLPMVIDLASGLYGTVFDRMKHKWERVLNIKVFAEPTNQEWVTKELVTYN